MAALRSVGCGEQRAERRQRTFHQNLTSKQIEDLDDTKHNFSLTQADRYLGLHLRSESSQSSRRRLHDWFTRGK